nr:immunoglobulin heavy chain junction region [Macaca mulatta]MOY23526.1 immunoglobulin heavy chain junction region [Macaca mulatta]MOY23533.1 immunoglobulin heavy chain junction region [Macaca mulatta]MOY24675.1 immunoglobulin heavy chain junction region [Macaca mulatta]MOY25495.1 immunoglobulin heavy chain junction region [Macaca mulatta]
CAKATDGGNLYW